MKDSNSIQSADLLIDSFAYDYNIILQQDENNKKFSTIEYYDIISKQNYKLLDYVAFVTYLEENYKTYLESIKLSLKSGGVAFILSSDNNFPYRIFDSNNNSIKQGDGSHPEIKIKNQSQIKSNINIYHLFPQKEYIVKHYEDPGKNCRSITIIQKRISYESQGQFQ